MSASINDDLVVGSGKRQDIPDATNAALWALGNRGCYFPACPQPVVVEVRAGVYRKNVIVSHIYGVKPKAPRHRPDMPDEERDSFKHLILLCLPHSSEVDHPKTGAELYPDKLLLSWKASHEGDLAPALAALGTIAEEELSDLLASAFAPPLAQLKELVDELSATGNLTASNLNELQLVVRSLTDRPEMISGRIVSDLVWATETLRAQGIQNLPKRLEDLNVTLRAVVKRLPEW